MCCNTPSAEFYYVVNGVYIFTVAAFLVASAVWLLSSKRKQQSGDFLWMVFFLPACGFAISFPCMVASVAMSYSVGIVAGLVNSFVAPLATIWLVGSVNSKQEQSRPARVQTKLEKVEPIKTRREAIELPIEVVQEPTHKTDKPITTRWAQLEL